MMAIFNGSRSEIDITRCQLLRCEQPGTLPELSRDIFVYGTVNDNCTDDVDCRSIEWLSNDIVTYCSFNAEMKVSDLPKVFDSDFG